MPRRKPYPKRKRGGLRLPSEEKLQKALEEVNETYKKRITLWQERRPMTCKVYGKDLKKLRDIGEGQWDVGFYRVMALAHQCWVTTQELKLLRKLSTSGNAREGFVQAMKLVQRELDSRSEEE